MEHGEAWLRDGHTSQCSHGTWTNHEPRRHRKLLLHRGEIDKLLGKTRESGMSLGPLSLYFSDGKAKGELALAKGKSKHDKRQAIAERDAQREIDQAMGRARKGKRP